MTTEDNNDYRGGHTPFTPPPATGAQPASGQPASSEAPPAPQPGAVRPQAAPRSPGATAILVVTAVIGGLAVIGTGGTAAFAAAGALSASSSERGDSVQTAEVDGIDRLDLDVDAGSMRIEFADVQDAELEVSGGRSPGWTLDREGDALVVRSPEFRWGWWFGEWFGDEQSAVLTLPESLRSEAIDADLTLDAGSLDVRGGFGDLDITVNAGSLDVDAEATALTVDMSAGRADVVVDGADQAELGVSAGDLRVELTGTPPTQTRIDVSAGSVDLTVPDTSYAITQDVSAGSLDAGVDQDSSSRRSIDVSLSAGSVTIRPGS